VHRWLCEASYWAAGIPLATVQAAVQNALNFGVYCGAELVGFARVVTDYATFAYVGDVFVLPEHRGYVEGAPDPLAAPSPNPRPGSDPPRR
jgi:hypothetical protein